MPSASTSTVSVNSSRERVARDVVQHPRDHARADDDRERHQRGHLERRQPERQPQRRVVLAAAKERGKQHQHEDGEQVLDHQPADGDVAGFGVELVVVGQHANQHDGARDGQRHPEHEPRGPAPAERVREQRAERRGHRALPDRAGHRDAPHREQVLDVEVQADAEHQQDDADLGQLLGEARVGDEARRVRPDEQAGQQIADDRRQPEPVRDVAQDERRRQAAGERQDQVGTRACLIPSSRAGQLCRRAARAALSASCVDVGARGRRVDSRASWKVARGEGARSGRRVDRERRTSLTPGFSAK